MKRRNQSCLITAMAAALAAIGAMCVAPAALAQSAMFLAPESYELPANARVAIFIDRSHLGEEPDDPARVERAPWPIDHVDWFFVRAAGTQENRDALTPDDEAGERISMPLSNPGIALIGFDTKPRIEEVDPEAFHRFLLERVGEAALPEDMPAFPEDRPLRIRRIESAKTLVRVGQQAGGIAHSATALSKSGQTAEIRPIMDPTSVRLGSDLVFRIYIDSPTATGRILLATHVSTGKIIQANIDREGMAAFTVNDAGVWRIEVHAARLIVPDDEEPGDVTGEHAATDREPPPDWELISATMTFNVPAGEGGS